MRCPARIEPILLKLLRSGVLHIRSAAWDGNADLAATLADHLHNLPGLLADYRPEGLDYYWNVERSQLIADAPAEHLAPYEELWRQLEEAMDSLTTASQAS